MSQPKKYTEIGETLERLSAEAAKLGHLSPRVTNRMSRILGVDLGNSLYDAVTEFKASGMTLEEAMQESPERRKLRLNVAVNIRDAAPFYVKRCSTLADMRYNARVWIEHTVFSRYGLNASWRLAHATRLFDLWMKGEDATYERLEAMSALEMRARTRALLQNATDMQSAQKAVDEYLARVNFSPISYEF